MIYYIHHYHLRNNELLQFMTDILKVCSQHSTEPMKLAAFITALVTDTGTFDQLFKLDPASPITQELINLDNLRDDCLKGINKVLDGYSYYFLPANRDAAKLLINSMNKYGTKIYQLNYPAETTSIVSLVSDWKNTPALASAITLLNLDAWVTELTTRNTAFNDKYLSRAMEQSSLPQVKTFDARVKLVASYKNLTDQIEAGAKFMGDNSYNVLINLMNELITKYNVIADSHITEKKKPTA